MNIRFAQEKDLKQLVELCKSHAEYEKAEYDSNGKKQRLSKAIFSEQDVFKCLVVEKDNQLFGYATFMKQFSTWDVEFYIYLDCLYLKPETRGQGIGSEIMNQIVTYAKKEHCNIIQWQTPDFNEQAIQFYKKKGASSKSKERFFWKL